MSVFTSVTRAQLGKFLERYELGKARDFSPVEAGITNTNYYLRTEHGDFVLTLYEHHSDEELDYLLGLQLHLASKSVLCPAPVRDRRGDLFSTLNKRPAAINTRLPGEPKPSPGSAHCAAIGAELARFHLAGRDYRGQRANPRGADWTFAAGDMLAEQIGAEDRKLLSATLREYAEVDFDALPSGAIHADLFHDNALFDGDRLCGVIDFDYACNDSFILDIAVVLHDWCIDAQGGFDDARLEAVIDAYQQQRRLLAAELAALPVMLRFSALRFWLSRLHDKVFPLPGELTWVKDPDIFVRLSKLRLAEDEALQRRFAEFLLPT